MEPPHVPSDIVSLPVVVLERITTAAASASGRIFPEAQLAEEIRLFYPIPVIVNPLHRGVQSTAAINMKLVVEIFVALAADHGNTLTHNLSLATALDIGTALWVAFQVGSRGEVNLLQLLEGKFELHGVVCS